MELIDLKRSQILPENVRETVPIFEQPFLPIAANYLTGIKIHLKGGGCIDLQGGEHINPDGYNMGEVDITSDVHMICKDRICRVAGITRSKKYLAGFAVHLNDGGMYVLTKGWLNE